MLLKGELGQCTVGLNFPVRIIHVMSTVSLPSGGGVSSDPYIMPGYGPVCLVITIMAL